MSRHSTRSLRASLPWSHEHGPPSHSAVLRADGSWLATRFVLGGLSLGLGGFSILCSCLSMRSGAPTPAVQVEGVGDPLVQLGRLGVPARRSLVRLCCVPATVLGVSLGLGRMYLGFA